MYITYISQDLGYSEEERIATKDERKEHGAVGDYSSEQQIRASTGYTYH